MSAATDLPAGIGLAGLILAGLILAALLVGAVLLVGVIVARYGGEARRERRLAREQLHALIKIVEHKTEEDERPAPWQGSLKLTKRERRELRNRVREVTRSANQKRRDSPRADLKPILNERRRFGRKARETVRTPGGARDPETGLFMPNTREGVRWLSPLAGRIQEIDRQAQRIARELRLLAADALDDSEGLLDQKQMIAEVGVLTAARIARSHRDLQRTGFWSRIWKTGDAFSAARFERLLRARGWVRTESAPPPESNRSMSPKTRNHRNAQP